MNKLRILFLAVFLLFAVNAPAQTGINLQAVPDLPKDEVQQLIDEYGSIPISDLLEQFNSVKADMPVKDALAGLPNQWLALTRTPAQIGDTRLWRVGSKALKLTGSNYEFIYLENRSPLAASDSNCLLVVTSAMLSLTEGDDDALLGVIVHEIAHGIFAQDSVDTKIQFNAAIRAKDYIKADQLRKHLALTEIKCDLIAGRILREAKLKIARYAELHVTLQQVEEKMAAKRSLQWHPSGELRKQTLLTLFKNESTKLAKK